MHRIKNTKNILKVFSLIIFSFAAFNIELSAITCASFTTKAACETASATYKILPCSWNNGGHCTTQSATPTPL